MSKIIGDINQQIKQATPPEELRERFMDRSRPATEAEHWARRHIEELERELSEPVILSEWQQLVQERDALQADNAKLVAALTLATTYHEKKCDCAGCKALAKVRKT